MKRKILRTISFTLKISLGLLFISPIIIAFLFSIKPEAELMSLVPSLFTDNPTLHGYITVLDRVPIFRYLLNSLIMCLIVIVVQVFLGSLCAYAFAFFDFPFKRTIFTIIIATMMIPGEVVIITNFTTIQSWGLTDSYLGLVLPSLISGTAIFIMRQYYLTIPKELKDAATMDGCGHLGFLFRIAMPISIPAMISLSFYLFIAVYNSYFWPLLVTNTDEFRTIQVGMAMLLSSERLEYTPLLAGSIIAILPAIIIFIFGQKYLVKGMTSGAIKG